MCSKLGIFTNIRGCFKNSVYLLNDSVSFEYPSGWTNLKCRSKVYPNFDTADPCICPGDPDLSEQQHKEILELCYWEDEDFNVSAASMSVPMKKRCGVQTLESITKENMCYCTERTNQAAGMRKFSTKIKMVYKTLTLSKD